MVVQETEPAEFNGMSQAVFEAGNHIKDLLDGLDDETAAELRPKLAQEIVNQALSRPASDTEINELIIVLTGGLARLDEHQQMQRRKTAAPEQVDTDY